MVLDCCGAGMPIISFYTTKLFSPPGTGRAGSSVLSLFLPIEFSTRKAMEQRIPVRCRREQPLFGTFLISTKMGFLV